MRTPALWPLLRTHTRWPLLRTHALWPLLAALMMATGCNSPMEYEDDWLDGPAVHDPSLNDPDYRLSTRSGLTQQDRGRPVIIAAHGFTASTYEWREFRQYAEANSTVLVSLVLLGAHGRSLDEFTGSTWQEWGRPILEEYEALVAQGYTSISLAGSSTGGALMLEQLASGSYRGATPPRHFFFVDPIVVPSDKNLSLIPLLKHLVSHTVTEGTAEEAPHWYSNRPTVALAQLNALALRVRTQLARGVQLPAGAQAKVYKTRRDGTADPVSALLIYKGLKGAGGATIDVQMLDSELHVFTRLNGRNPALVSAADRQRQQQAFDDMIARAGR
jgi:carboxylesterase